MKPREIWDVLSEVHYLGYDFRMEVNGSQVSINCTYKEPDVQSGSMETQNGRPWAIDPSWGAQQIVQTALKAILTSLEHRCREHFTWRGRAIYQPHFDLETLWTAAPERV